MLSAPGPRVVAALSLLLISSLPFNESIAGQGVSQFGLASGATVPTGAFHSGPLGGFNVGWQGMALVGLKLPASGVGLCMDVAYGANGANNQFKTIYQGSIGRPTDETSKLLGADVDLTYALPSTSHVKPYLLAGIGVYHAKISMTASQ